MRAFMGIEPLTACDRAKLERRLVELLTQALSG